MRILILGGSGFVSGHMAKLAYARDMEVFCVTRGNRPLPSYVHPIVADRSDAAALDRALAETGLWFDAVMDCICYNAQQAQTALSVLPAYTNRIVIISTDSVYHPYHKSVPQTEHAFVYLTDGSYGAKKREMEEEYLKEAGGRLNWTIFRPGHIFGTGSKLGCYPELTRRDDMIQIICEERPLPLVGGGEFLIHPIWAGDLCRVMLDCIPNEKTFGEIFCIGGPDVVTNAEYYRILGRLTGHAVTIQPVPLEGYLDAHPQYSGHLCHRAYDLSKLKNTGIALPDTHLQDGLREQLRQMGVLSERSCNT